MQPGSRERAGRIYATQPASPQHTYQNNALRQRIVRGPQLIIT